MNLASVCKNCGPQQHGVALIHLLITSYKRQMDEMQRAFNRTTTRLTENARKAAQNEKRQEEAIKLVQVNMTQLRNEVSCL